MKRRVFLTLALLLAVNLLVVWGQSLVSFWKWRGPSSCLMPEARYYLQSLVVFVPLIPLALLRVRHGRKILVFLLVALVLHAAGYLVKAHVPGSRRNQHLAACDWAVETIREDFRGPKRDQEPFYTSDDYHPLGRPVVQAHVNRVTYLLGGRIGSVFNPCAKKPLPQYITDKGNYLAEIPDYIVDEPHRINRGWWTLAEFEKLGERTFGNRLFVIYKRVKRN